MPNAPLTSCYKGKMSSPWSLAVNWIFAPGQTSILGCDKALWQPPIALKRHQAINANNYYCVLCVLGV